MRWSMYIDAVVQAVENGNKFDQKELDNSLKNFEEDWVASKTKTKRRIESSLQEYAHHLLRKYEIRIN